ncbi:MAG TPA: chemotaxis protein [Patescibacteria group bacterium]|nr:chemotaxis protein [Patescibacteria group bacterium]
MTEQSGILLETGTNEFEIIEFSVGPVVYGINVAKVREVINPVPVTQIPNAHPFVDGIFTLRGKIMPLVNLARCLGCHDETDSYKIIVSELNNYYVGFLVNDVSRIHRISWTAMEPPPDVSDSEMVVGIVRLAEKMVILLDFERILSDINPEIQRKFSSVKPEVIPDLINLRKNKTILLAEDSKMLRELVVNTLHTAGYLNVMFAEDGLQAWTKIEQLLADKKPIEEKLQLVITDIEMPQMDGHHLTRRIKENEKLAHLPVIIFSSLINDEMKRKGESIGASAQVSKPEINQLIDLVDKLVI